MERKLPSMGMSASQARLLSITSRLTNNEFRSQTITNSKLRLAAASQEASKDYMDALNSQQIMFMNYDDNGAASKVELTPAVLYDYAPLKNQYMLTNSAGKVLVNNTEIKNYEKTDGLANFLREYGLLEDYIVETEPAKYATEKTREDNPEYVPWKEREPKQEDYKKTEKVKIGEKTYNKWVHTNSKVYDAIANISCFSIVQNSKARCYMHVLAALLGFGEHTTSDGNTFVIEREEDIGWQWNSCTEGEAATMTGLREEMKSDPVYDEPYNDELETEAHGLVTVGGDGTDASKYNVPNGGNCWQKCIDLAWELHFNYDGSSTGGTASEDELKKFWYFVELDLGEGHFEESKEDVYDEREVDDVEKWQEAHDRWKDEEEPKYLITEREVMVKEPVETSFIIVNDPDKAQWYTNLWYKMNGSESCNVVSEYADTADKFPELEGKQLFAVHGAVKNTNGTHYEEYESNLFKSADWLKFALEHGIVTMEQAQYFNPEEDGGKAMELTSKGYRWNNITYTSARDFVQQNNEKAIAMAEVKYKKRITEIENQDTKFDQDLKKLDTEHSALQTEYEAIKEVLSKNVERSFKAFS